MISPDGEVKSLEESLFKGLSVAEDSEALLAEGKITPAQYNVYKLYQNN